MGKNVVLVQYFIKLKFLVVFKVIDYQESRSLITTKDNNVINTNVFLIYIVAWIFLRTNLYPNFSVYAVLYSLSLILSF